MLHAFHDVRSKDRFEELFGNLRIGKHPTPYRNKSLVLHLDFSQVGGSIDNLEGDAWTKSESNIQQLLGKHCISTENTQMMLHITQLFESTTARLGKTS